jgi:hypothetical protein
MSQLKTDSQILAEREACLAMLDRPRPAVTAALIAAVLVGMAVIACDWQRVDDPRQDGAVWQELQERGRGLADARPHGFAQCTAKHPADWPEWC